MKSLIHTYDRHLKKLASVPPSKIMGVIYGVIAPWAQGLMAAYLLVEIFRLPRNLGAWVIFPTSCVALVGVIYAVSRVNRYFWESSRTPTDSTLRGMPGADALISALQRVTLNGLSDLTPSTRLQTDLKLTPEDLSQLLGILRSENRLNSQSLEDVKAVDMTVGALLQRMSRA